MKILRAILIVVVALVVIALAAAAVMPKTVDIEKSVVIDAPTAQVWPHIKYFEKQQAWSPWYETDPDAVITTEGTDGTVGAVNRWKGEKIGVGSQTVTAITEEDRWETDLSFAEDGGDKAQAYLDLDPVDAGTRVTWGLHTDMSWPMNIIGPMIKSGVGNDYEKGLNNLKLLVEAEPPMVESAPMETISTDSVEAVIELE